MYLPPPPPSPPPLALAASPPPPTVPPPPPERASLAPGHLGHPRHPPQQLQPQWGDGSTVEGGGASSTAFLPAGVADDNDEDAAQDDDLAFVDEMLDDVSVRGLPMCKFFQYINT